MLYVIYQPAGLSQKIQNILHQLFYKKSKIIKTVLGLSFKDYESSSARSLAALQASGQQLNVLFYPKYYYLKMQYNWTRRYFELHPNSIAVTWNGMKGTRGVFMSAAKDAGVKTLYLENACFNGYVAQDSKGINFDNSLPRNSEFYYAWSKTKVLNSNLISQVKSQLQSRKLQFALEPDNCDSPKCENYIFCALQVENDTQMRLFSPWIDSLEEFIEILLNVSEILPSGWQLRLKEHPSSKKRLTNYIKSKQSKKFILDNTTNTLSQIEKSRGVLCINSSVGLQAFLYNKPVLTLGKCFYSFSQMACQVDNIFDLKKLLEFPEQLSFNQELRNIFIHYILTEYYVKCQSPI